jgi:site-specific DNA-methyltransferase (cytosine-N4-specific)
MPARMRDVREKVDRLIAADWDFVTARTQSGVHGVHPYPAKFIPQIPRQLIDVLSPEPSSTIFDPFCGSGTTLVEAQAMGYRSVGIDLNPIATLISRVKTDSSAESIGDSANEIVAKFGKRESAIPPIPNLDHWFAKDVQKALASLSAGIARCTHRFVGDGLRLAFSAITVRVSNQDGDTRYAAVPKNVSREQVFELFARAAHDIDAARAIHFGGLFHSTPEAKVVTADILSVAPSDIGQVDLVITSPPYPNAYEYWLYHKYRMYWLGFDPIAVRQAEIGARPHFFKKNHHTPLDFERQMATVFRLLSAIMPSGAVACFLVATSKIHGAIVDNAALLRQASAPNGFAELATIQRKVPVSRKTFNPANARTIEESLLVFARC